MASWNLLHLFRNKDPKTDHIPEPVTVQPVVPTVKVEEQNSSSSALYLHSRHHGWTENALKYCPTRHGDEHSHSE